MNNSIEAQIAELDNEDDKALFMEEYKMKEPALNKLIRSAYKLLQLYTYFTAGVQKCVHGPFTKDGKRHKPQALSIPILKKGLSKQK